MVKNAASKNAGFTPNFAKNHIRITLHKNDLSLFVFDKVKFEKSMQKLQTFGGRGEARPAAAAALGGARRHSEEFAAGLQYCHMNARVRGLRVSAAREPFFIF